jgi:putative inorganic carbon (hco3(-)) transporter
MTARVLGPLWPLGLALTLAAAWPVVAYRVHPAVFPALLVAAAVLALVVRRPAAGIALVLVLAPFTNAALAGGRPLRFLVSGLAVALLGYGLLVVRRREPVGRGLPLAVCVFVAAAGASSLGALDPAASVTSFLGVAVAAVLFFAVVQICHSREQLVVVVAGAVGGLLVAGAQGVVQKLSGRVSEAGVLVGDEVVGRVAGSFSHPNQFAGFLIALIPLALTLAVDRRAASPALRRLAAVAATLALGAVAFSFTRGAVAGLVAGGLVWLAVVRPRVAVAALVVVAIGGVMLTPAALKDRLTDPAGEDLGLRADLWSSALDLYGTRPLLGVGLGNFGEAYGRLPSTGTQRRLLHQRQVLVPPHANNLFLTILAEQGIIGALAFLGLLGAALWSCARAARREDVLDRALGVGVGAGLCALLAHSLLEYTLFGEVALPLFALLGVLAVREGASG